MQTILSVFVLLVAPGTVFSYPVFGTKRYQRASYQPAPFQPYQQQPLYDDPYPAYRQPAAASASASYSDYDPSDSSYYYQPRRAVTNERYTSYGMPTYHGEYKSTPYYYSQGPVFSYNDDRDNTPMDDLHDEMMQEDEYDRSRDSFPLGQEVWFEPPGRNQESLARVNAAFLRNLMLYNSQFGRPNLPFARGGAGDSGTNPAASHFNEYDYDDVPMNPDWFDAPSEPVRSASPALSASAYDQVIKPAPEFASRISNKLDSRTNSGAQDDQDVKQLKALVNSHRRMHDSMYSQQDIRNEDVPALNLNMAGGQDYDNADLDSEYDDTWINWDSKRSTEPKKSAKSLTAVLGSSSKGPAFSAGQAQPVAPTTTDATTTTTIKHTKLEGHMPVPAAGVVDKNHPQGGQKEIVLLRPANPVRHPFRAPVFNTLDYAPQEDKKIPKQPHSSGAIYDTIKHMLTMEQQLEASAQQKQQQQHVHQKRFVTNEESLVEQLNSLKKQYAA